MIESVRNFQAAVSRPPVAKALSVCKFSVGNSSESVAAFDPDPFRAVVAELAGQFRPLPGELKVTAAEYINLLIVSPDRKLAAPA